MSGGLYGGGASPPVRGPGAGTSKSWSQAPPGVGAGVDADAGPGPGVRSGFDAGPGPGAAAGGVAETEPGVEAGDEGGAQGAGWRSRVGSALRERLPVWLQLRCGLEPRTLAALGVVLVAATAFAVAQFWSARPGSVPAPERVAVGEAARDSLAETGGGAGSGKAVGADGGALGADSGGAADTGSTGGAVAGPGPGSGRIVVDVSGKVRRPGIQELPPGARVVDALRAAGGARPGVDLDDLNRARLLVDGEQIVVGAPPGQAVSGGTGSGAGGASAVSGTGATGPVSLNGATVDQLDTLPGVGPVLAQHIVDYRLRHGGFRSVDELREVNGIGDRRFADLRPLVRP